MQRFKEKYTNEVRPRLAEEFASGNVYALPRISKIVVSIGAGEISRNEAQKESLTKALSAITGQKPKVTKARVSVAAFNIRAGMEVGLSVTLRKENMYAFLDRLISIALPRLRDFRGLSGRSFDKFGNATFGFDEISVFPEVDTLPTSIAKGFSLTIVFVNSSPEKSKRLLQLFGMPFAK